MEEEYEGHQVAPPIPYGFGAEKASIIERINPEDIIELIRKRLMGLVQDPKTMEWKKSKILDDISISEVGAWQLSNLLLSVSNSNTALSKLDDKTIRKRAYGITETAIKMVLGNWMEYKITNRAQIAFVADIMYSLTFITLKMADMEGIRKMITGMYSEQRTINEIGEIKKKFFRRGN